MEQVDLTPRYAPGGILTGIRAEWSLDLAQRPNTPFRPRRLGAFGVVGVPPQPPRRAAALGRGAIDDVPVPVWVRTPTRTSSGPFRLSSVSPYHSAMSDAWVGATAVVASPPAAEVPVGSHKKKKKLGLIDSDSDSDSGSTSNANSNTNSNSNSNAGSANVDLGAGVGVNRGSFAPSGRSRDAITNAGFALGVPAPNSESLPRRRHSKTPALASDGGAGAGAGAGASAGAGAVIMRRGSGTRHKPPRPTPSYPPAVVTFGDFRQSSTTAFMMHPHAGAVAGTLHTNPPRPGQHTRATASPPAAPSTAGAPAGNPSANETVHGMRRHGDAHGHTGTGQGAAASHEPRRAVRHKPPPLSRSVSSRLAGREHGSKLWRGTRGGGGGGGGGDGSIPARRSQKKPSSLQPRGAARAPMAGRVQQLRGSSHRLGVNAAPLGRASRSVRRAISLHRLTSTEAALVCDDNIWAAATM